jgi:hypothetical protein
MIADVCFPQSYAAGRALFLQRAVAAGAGLTHLRHDTALGPDGEALFCDVARLGPVDASRRLLVISGTHGIEGYFGSALQSEWLASDEVRELPADTAVILVHALNLWGFAHDRRGSENNVDLNRNFVDHSARRPDNPDYAELHRLLCMDDWTEASVAQASDALREAMASLGRNRFVDAVVRGQYSHPDGLSYGGREAEWSNTTLRTIVRAAATGAGRIGLIDLHTGLGRYGEAFLLCFHDPGSSAFIEAERWWGTGSLSNDDAGFERSGRPNYHGLLFDAVLQEVGAVPTTGAVVEIGTRSNLEMLRALQQDRWLRFGRRTDAQTTAAVSGDLLDAFCPRNPAWRTAAISRGMVVVRQAVQGVASW